MIQRLTKFVTFRNVLLRVEVYVSLGIDTFMTNKIDENLDTF